MDKKAKCANCGEAMTENHTDNYNLYCKKEECIHAFMMEATKLRKGKRKNKLREI
jgi:hypothetical protein